MQVTIEIPDALVTEAEEAAGRINDRRQAEVRSDRPLKLTGEEACLVVINHLINVILTDQQEVGRLSVDAETRRFQERLTHYRDRPGTD